MTDWIKHTGDTCPVDPETVVFVRYGSGLAKRGRANGFPWWMRNPAGITHYRIITPAEPPEPEGKEIDPQGTQMWTERHPDLITLRLECLKLAVRARETVKWGKTPPSVNDLADRFLRYAIDGSVDKA